MTLPGISNLIWLFWTPTMPKHTAAFLPSTLSTFGSADSYFVNANITPTVIVLPALIADGTVTGYLVNLNN